MSVWRVALHVINKAEVADVNSWHWLNIGDSSDCHQKNYKKINLKKLIKNKDAGHCVITEYVILLITTTEADLGL